MLQWCHHQPGALVQQPRQHRFAARPEADVVGYHLEYALAVDLQPQHALKLALDYNRKCHEGCDLAMGGHIAFKIGNAILQHIQSLAGNHPKPCVPEWPGDQIRVEVGFMRVGIDDLPLGRDQEQIVIVGFLHEALEVLAIARVQSPIGVGVHPPAGLDLGKLAHRLARGARRLDDSCIQ